MLKLRSERHVSGSSIAASRSTPAKLRTKAPWPATAVESARTRSSIHGSRSLTWRSMLVSCSSAMSWSKLSRGPPANGTHRACEVKSCRS